MAKLNTSPRPKARPSKAKTGYATLKTSSACIGGAGPSGIENRGSTGIGSGGGNRQPQNLNERKPDQKAALQCPTLARDISLLLNRRCQKRTGTGGDLNRILPDTTVDRAPRRLRQFNGKRGGRIKLGL